MIGEAERNPCFADVPEGAPIGAANFRVESIAGPREDAAAKPKVPTSMPTVKAAMILFLPNFVFWLMFCPLFSHSSPSMSR
jgi:hypothetical protein